MVLWSTHAHSSHLDEWKQRRNVARRCRECVGEGWHEAGVEHGAQQLMHVLLDGLSHCLTQGGNAQQGLLAKGSILAPCLQPLVQLVNDAAQVGLQQLPAAIHASYSEGDTAYSHERGGALVGMRQ